MKNWKVGGVVEGCNNEVVKWWSGEIGLRGVVEEWSGNWPLNVYQGWDFALLVFALVAL